MDVKGSLDVIDGCDDVEPISVRPKTSLMKIKYSRRFETCFSYFRAFLERDELSERSFRITGECIDLLPSNFSVWYFRRRCLKELPHHLKNELKFVDDIIMQEPKNYQVWHHRKSICECLDDGSDEKRFTDAVLAMDEKNYHAWQHRQWAIAHFKLWDGELDFTTSLIDQDTRNNSAWNHRYYIVKSTQMQNEPKWLSKELDFVGSKIELDLTNESSWSYLRGLLKLTYNSLSLSDEWAEKYCWRLYGKRKCRSPHLLSMLVDITREQIQNTDDKSQGDKENLVQQARSLCEELQTHDKIRYKYWQYILQNIG